MNKGINLQTYIINNNITKKSDLLYILLNNKFKIITEQSGGNNYHYFKDEKGFIRFNNEKLGIKDNMTNIYAGCVNESHVGNNIRLSNLMIYSLNENVKDLINYIINVDKEIKRLKEEKQIAQEKIFYMRENELEELNIEEFEQNKKNEIEKSLKNVSILI